MSQRPSITLNRALKANWLCEALRLRAEGIPVTETTERLRNLLGEEISGKDSIQKSVRYLRQVWLEESPKLSNLQEEGVALYCDHPSINRARFLSLFMTAATYPFVREVMETCGKLHRLQGSVKTEQIKRRFSSTYGERESVVRSTRYAVSLLADFGLLQSGESRGTHHAGKSRCDDGKLAAFGVTALFLSTMPAVAISRTDLENHPALFAHDGQTLVDLALRDRRFAITRESYSLELVHLK